MASNVVQVCQKGVDFVSNDLLGICRYLHPQNLINTALLEAGSVIDCTLQSKVILLYLWVVSVNQLQGVCETLEDSSLLHDTQHLPS